MAAPDEANVPAAAAAGRSGDAEPSDPPSELINWPASLPKVFRVLMHGTLLGASTLVASTKKSIEEKDEELDPLLGSAHSLLPLLESSLTEAQYNIAGAREFEAEMPPELIEEEQAIMAADRGEDAARDEGWVLQRAVPLPDLHRRLVALTEARYQRLRRASKSKGKGKSKAKGKKKGKGGKGGKAGSGGGGGAAGAGGSARTGRQTRQLLVQAKAHRDLVAGAHLADHVQNRITNFASGGCPASLKYCLEAGTNIDTVFRPGGTCLRCAAGLGRRAAVRMLLDMGANLELTDDQGFGPLASAVQIDDLEVVEMLLDAGADIEARTLEGFTPLAVAAFNGSAKVVPTLLARGAILESRNVHGNTPAIHAAASQSVEVLKLLIAAGADLGARTSMGGTALHMAAEHSNAGAIHLLVDAGVDVNSTVRGATALDFAARSQDIVCCTTLMLCGGKRGVLPLSVAGERFLAGARQYAQVCVAVTHAAKEEAGAGTAPSTAVPPDLATPPSGPLFPPGSAALSPQVLAAVQRVATGQRSGLRPPNPFGPRRLETNGPDIFAVAAAALSGQISHREAGQLVDQFNAEPAQPPAGAASGARPPAPPPGAEAPPEEAIAAAAAAAGVGLEEASYLAQCAEFGIDDGEGDID